uniref:Guanine nucleotide-binding protein-like 3 N-terminal domain-containing protein n=1 Tax=Brassica oleracea TaxID=3712 RepID=A0A3P6EDI1_BRAOL|nr:unnamed protein product [Brassica oleracea]
MDGSAYQVFEKMLKRRKKVTRKKKRLTRLVLYIEDQLTYILSHEESNNSDMLDRKWKIKRKKKRITEISEGKSKRVTLKQKHKVIRKVKEHHKRKEKDAKKLGHCRKPRVEKDASIPSDWPFKEHELKGLEARRARALEEIEQKKVARKERAKRRKRWIQGSENYGSYTRSKCCKEIKIGVWRNMTRNWPCRVMKDAAEKGNKSMSLRR